MHRLMVKLLTDDAVIPSRRQGDAGFDLYGLERAANVLLEPQATIKLQTGVAIKIPTGFVGFIKERSSLGSKGIAVRAGVIDSSYTGEVIVCLTNTNSTWYELNMQNAIAQLLIIANPDILVTIEDDLEETIRGAAGFGSTDKMSVFNQSRQTVLGSQFNGIHINENRG